MITDTNLMADKLEQASEIVEKAKYAWAHQEFNNEIHVELCDGVIDLTNMTGNFLISGDMVVLPTEYAAGIEQNTIYILPKDASGQGDAYRAHLKLNMCRMKIDRQKRHQVLDITLKTCYN